MRTRSVAWLAVLSVLAFILVAASSASAQSDEPSLAFNPQEVPLHTALAERLSVYLDHEKNSRWGDLYDMLYKPAEWKMSREQFIADMTKRETQFPAHTLDLRPEFVGNRKNPDHAQYALLGCLEQEHWGRKKWIKGGVEAHLVNGEWLFSAFYVIAGRGQPPTTCEFKLVK
jgi:hypothetical protein